MKIDLKAILFTTVVPLITMVAPEAGKLVSDLQIALADGKVTGDEAKTLIGDTLTAAKAVLPPAWDEVMDALKVNLEVDLPNIESTIAKISAAVKPATDGTPA